jgi:hypothetical protein
MFKGPVGFASLDIVVPCKGRSQEPESRSQEKFRILNSGARSQNQEPGEIQDLEFRSQEPESRSQEKFRILNSGARSQNPGARIQEPGEIQDLEFRSQEPKSGARRNSGSGNVLAVLLAPGFWILAPASINHPK